jgi:hypothetical protein
MDGVVVSGLPQRTHWYWLRFRQAILRRAERRLICFWCALTGAIGERFFGRLARFLGAEDTLDTLGENALVLPGYIVLFYRILIMMDMVLNIVNTETHDRCRIFTRELLVLF